MIPGKRSGSAAPFSLSKNLAEFAAISGEEFFIIFGRGMYLDEMFSPCKRAN